MFCHPLSGEQEDGGTPSLRPMRLGPPPASERHPYTPANPKTPGLDGCGHPQRNGDPCPLPATHARHRDGDDVLLCLPVGMSRGGDSTPQGWYPCSVSRRWLIGQGGIYAPNGIDDEPFFELYAHVDALCLTSRRTS